MSPSTNKKFYLSKKTKKGRQHIVRHKHVTVFILPTLSVSSLEPQNKYDIRLSKSTVHKHILDVCVCMCVL